MLCVGSLEGKLLFLTFFPSFDINIKIKLSLENSSDDSIYFWLQITDIFLHKILQFKMILKVVFILSP